ncbi:histidine kinase [Acidisarcina polymorpha]|uniref:histidine kinase n=1 Tax=Acidisarcina polymorpha TaxID=2211140 RepID=A0A2Z5FXM1_9BACT|nr:ATP-binding protein [Acidisarcina polymorpha]AXC11126.1 histidine kinase [Acidisarcina polymorpha]
MIVGLLIFEVLLVAVFAFFIVREHQRELSTRERRRLEYQSTMLALLAQDAINENRVDLLQKTISAMMRAPSISAVQVTDLDGKTILSSDPTLNGKSRLTESEKRYLGVSNVVSILDVGGHLEAVSPVVIDGKPQALSWIYPNEDSRRTEMNSQLEFTLAFAAVGALGCILLAEYLARSVTRPLSRLLTATRRIIRDPVDTSTIEPDVSASSEVADLTLAFNLMVAAIEEQRAGLNDTLGLLDSMLAHAPIGIAFFDSHSRFIRMNQFFADMNELSVGKHIGRNVREIFPGPPGQILESGIQQVLSTAEPARDLEITAGIKAEDGRFSTWLVNLYPVRTATHGVRWVGAVIVDTTAIKRSEDALRRTEKLAAVGRLSASIAHEINNPLEAITNLLYLLSGIEGLDARLASYLELAQHEVARMSEIVQQTLRFHRQSTKQTVTNIGEILESVLSLYRGKVMGQQVVIERKYQKGVELLCFAGEMRQLFANLIGNALDAMPRQRGHLLLRVRYSRSPKDPSVRGVRVVVADTGYGMTSAVQRRIFEPFFTTKEATGTGLGLWVSAEIVQKHGGWVRVRSRTSQDSVKSGTVFVVFLPLQDQTAPTSGEEEATVSVS